MYPGLRMQFCDGDKVSIVQIGRFRPIGHIGQLYHLGHIGHIGYTGQFGGN